MYKYAYYVGQSSEHDIWVELGNLNYERSPSFDAIIVYSAKNLEQQVKDANSILQRQHEQLRQQQLRSLDGKL